MAAIQCLKNFSLLSIKKEFLISHRNVIILKRKFPIRLHKIGDPPKKMHAKDYIYDKVVDTYHVKKDSISVILIKYVEGLGKPGEQVMIRPFAGYDQFLLTGRAVYATPENIEKYSSKKDEPSTYSSKYSYKTIKILQDAVVSVEMNMNQPWTIEPWHFRVSLRKAGIIVPQEAITMPENRIISGPVPQQHNKEFYVVVTINNHEQVKVRCRVHLWTNKEEEQIPKLDSWIKSEPIFEQDRPVLDGMPLPLPPGSNQIYK